jgi:hypothetical protein
MTPEIEHLLRLLARIDTDGQSAEHVANLAVMYADKARRILARPAKAEPTPDPDRHSICHACDGRGFIDR